jgi:hypothetical protein
VRWRASRGEALLGLAFIAIGGFWIAYALRLPFWDGFAPATGFLPLIYGVLLVGLAMAATLLEATSGETPSSERGPILRPFLVLLTLAAGVAGIELIGFAVSMFLATLFLFHVIERIALLNSLAAAAGTAGVLTLVFRNGLGVPLPVGPWGF